MLVTAVAIDHWPTRKPIVDLNSRCVWRWLAGARMLSTWQSNYRAATGWPRDNMAQIQTRLRILPPSARSNRPQARMPPSAQNGPVPSWLFRNQGVSNLRHSDRKRYFTSSRY